MKKIKPHTTGILWLLLIGYSVFFSLRLIRQKGEWFRYDWKHKQRVLQLRVDTPPVIYYNAFIIPHKYEIPFSDDDVFQWQQNGKSYYFRADYIRKAQDETRFWFVRWFNNFFPKSRAKGTLTAWKIPPRQDGKISVVTLGDTYLKYKWANYFRKFIKEFNPNVRFLGRHTDIFGYPYEGGLLYSIKQVDSVSRDLSAAKYYIVSVGMHDDHMPLNQWETHLHNILRQLSVHPETRRIFLFELPAKRPLYVARNNIIRKYGKGKIRIVPTDSIARTGRNWDPGSGIPDKTGYELLARHIARQISDK